MGKKQELDRKNLDGLKWGSVSFLWILSFAAYYYFSTLAIPLKLIAWVVVLLISGFVLITTSKGKTIVGFVKNSYVELQKVVWPTRKEAGQLALIVMLVVVLAGLILWGVDSIVMWCIGKITLLQGI